MLSNRYSRQIALIGEENQLKLTQSSVLVVGAGGIGSPVLLYLVAAGIGKVGIVDHDNVSLSNLHRQILYHETDLGNPKSSAAFKTLTSLNSDIKINEHHTKLTLENAKELFSRYDLIIDGSDNFKTRYIVNDFCCQMNQAFISSSIFQDKIQIIFFDIKHGCYRCIFPEPPPPFLMSNCSDAGILGATTGIAGSITASLAIKYLIRSESVPTQKIITFDNNHFKTEHFPFKQNKHCSSCHEKLISWPAETANLRLEDISLENYTIINIKERHENSNTRLSLDELHIPLSELITLPSNIPVEKQLLLYCKSGQRSDYAAYFLRKNGFLAYSLEGGMAS